MLEQEETTTKNWLQRVRGAIGIGATWAAGWAPIGAVTGWITATLVDFPASIVAATYAAMFGGSRTDAPLARANAPRLPR